jgi:SOS-response transcriptional repressor LexA
MNQKELALLLNTARTALSESENGSREPSKDFILALSSIGVSIDWFLTGRGNPLQPEIENVLKNLDISSTARTDPEKLREYLSNIITENRLKNVPFDRANCLQKSSKRSLQSGPDRGMIEAAPGEEGPSGSVNDGTGKGDMAAVSEMTETVQEAIKRRLPVLVEGGEKGVLIPVIGQGLSAGLGFDYDEGEVVRFIKIPAWIARKSRDLVALPIYGDSMEPTMGRGDLAVCDSGGFKDDGIYVLRDEERGLMFCKRVVWAPGGWTIMSDNPRYGPMKVDDRAIQVVARVIAAIKEVK